MAKKDVKRFVLSDEGVQNSYGFYVSTQGIDMGRFEKNPVMLSDHVNANKWVLGRWKDWRVEGAQLTAEPEFDLEDEEAKKIAGKVERGFINGASIGILFGHEDLAFVDGKIFILRCELIEATICPVPSNPNALQLYLRGKEDTPLTEADIKQMCLSLNPTKPEKIKTEKMSKMNLAVKALIALGIMDAPDDGFTKAEIESHILKLSARVETAEKKASDLETENATLKAAAKTAATAEGTAFLTAAVQDGKIAADQVASYLSLYENNPALVKATIDAIPAKQSLSADGIKVPAGATPEVKTEEDFMKLDREAQLAFKTNHPDQYNKIFNTK